MTEDALSEEPVNEIPLEQPVKEVSLEPPVKEAPLEQPAMNKIPLVVPASETPHDELPNQVSVTDDVSNADAEGDKVRKSLQDDGDSLAGKRGRKVDGNDDDARHGGEIDDNAVFEKPAAPDGASNFGKENCEPVNDEESTLPQKPIKRARTGYFIFADEKRAEIQAKHPGENVGVVSRAIAQLWAVLSTEERTTYQEKSAQERERVAQELAKYKVDGGSFDTPKAFDPLALIFPVARIRKICKLDHEVNGVSKEAAMLITKCAELATVKLSQECVKVAQLQNRRKLLPDDIAQVCSTREQFLFLRDDVKDLVRDQKKVAEREKPAASTPAADSKPLTSYFAPRQL